MPIRAQAAGSRVSPCLGFRPPAWLGGRGGDRVMLLRRRPREVYRVYSEDEYLNGAGLDGAHRELAAPAAARGLTAAYAEDESRWTAPRSSWRPSTGSQARGERRLRRVAGVAMLAGAVGTVGGVVVLNSASGTHGRRRGPGSWSAAARSRVARSPVVDCSPMWRRLGRWSRVRRRHHALACRTRRTAATAEAGLRRTRSPPLHHGPARSVAIAVDYVAAARRGSPRGVARSLPPRRSEQAEHATTPPVEPPAPRGTDRPSSDSSAERCARALRTTRR